MLGASPMLGTGYGLLVRNIAPYLAQHFRVGLCAKGYRGLTVNWKGVQLIGSYEGARYSSALELERVVASIEQYKPKIVFTVGDILMMDYLVKLKEKYNFKWLAYYPIDSKPWRPLELELMEHIDIRVVPSHFAQDYLRKEEHISSIYIPHGIDADTFRPLPRREVRKYREEAGLDGFVFLYSGTNNLRKNIPTLLEAFLVVKDRIPSSKLVLNTCKQDSSGWDLEALIKVFGLEDRVLFPVETGYFGLPEQELVKLYNMADVYVTATQGEGFSLCNAEAMACGIVNIAPAHSALVELISNTGILTLLTGAGYYDAFGAWKPIPDAKDIARAMLYLYQHPEERKRLGSKARARIARHYNWKYILPKWKELIEEVI